MEKDVIEQFSLLVDCLNKRPTMTSVYIASHIGAKSLSDTQKVKGNMCCGSSQKKAAVELEHPFP